MGALDEPTLGEVIRNQNRMEGQLTDLARDVRGMLTTAQKLENVDGRLTTVEKALERRASADGVTVRQIFLTLGSILASAIVGAVIGVLVGK